jgi:triosephosphate isomerase (TIM)
MNPSRRPLIAGNWKMHHGGPTACQLAGDIARGALPHTAVDVLVAPPFTALAAVAAELSAEPGHDAVLVAGQNLYPGTQGAFTGEISGPMLVDCGARWVIVGHSERRQILGETDDLVARKAMAALDHQLLPIVCVGETLAERDASRTLEVITRQLEAALPALLRASGQAAVAYEPVWAIGTGRNASPEQAEEAHAALRARLEAASPELAARTRILYGGSVKGENAEGLLRCPNVDGALVGGASLDAGQFLGIVKAASVVAAAPAS